MNLKERQIVLRTPGNPKTATRKDWEWLCPDCDYFEEAEKEGT